MTQPGTVPPRTPCPPCEPSAPAPLIGAGAGVSMLLGESSSAPESDTDPDGPDTGPGVAG